MIPQPVERLVGRLASPCEIKSRARAMDYGANNAKELDLLRRRFQCEQIPGAKGPSTL